jgi:hypothetical protein
MVGAAGWAVLGPDPGIARWAAAALPAACAAIAMRPGDWRCGGTWHAGVDILPNGTDGSVGGVDFAWSALGLAPQPLHAGQVSVVRPGYPQPSDDEPAAAFGYRLRRDAAHVDGILPVGPMRQRMIREPHGWILGLPLNTCGAGASPLVVWEGSHHIMRAALLAACAGVPEQAWDQVDVTQPYQAARKRVFAECHRREIPVAPGQATLIHRLCLHGVAPWAMGAFAPPEGRVIAYFRPMLRSVAAWLHDL